MHRNDKWKRVQALGGAKNHMLVLPDADLDMAADAAVHTSSPVRVGWAAKTDAADCRLYAWNGSTNINKSRTHK